jgi:hypothetical protein
MPGREPSAPCVPAATPSGGASARPPRFYNDGEFDTLVTRPENVFVPDLRIYDVRDLLALTGAEYELLTGIPDIALRRHGATHADISLGMLRVAGPDETHRFVGDALDALRRASGTAGADMRPGARAGSGRRLMTAQSSLAGRRCE